MDTSLLMCDCTAVHVQAVEKAKAKMPTAQEIEASSYFFKILGDPTRMKIMWALECGELCVCDVAVILNMTKSAVSHQLNTLKQSRMVKARRDGKNVFYSIDDGHVTGIIKLAMTHTNH